MAAAALAVFVLMAAAAPCPDEGRIAEGLARAAPAEVLARYRWTVGVTDDSMRVALLDARGAVVRERTIAVPAKCSERETVAVAVLGAWMVAPPEAIPLPAPRAAAPEPKPAPAPAPAPVRVPPPEPKPAPSPARAAAPEPPAPETPAIPARPPPEPAPAPAPEPVAVAPAAEPVAAPAAAPAPAATANASPGTVSAEPSPGAGAPAASLEGRATPPAPSPSLRFEAAFDTRAQFAGAFAPGLGLTLGFGARLGGFVELSTALERSLPLPPGHVRWLRIALGLGIRYRFDLNVVYLEPMLSVEGAWVRLEGKDFIQNSVATGLDASACAQVRVGRGLGDIFGIYLGLRGCAWPLQPKVGVKAVPETVAMPAFELAALLGVSGGYTFVKGPDPMRPSEK